MKGRRMTHFRIFLLPAILCATVQAGEPATKTAPAAQPTGNPANVTGLSAVHVGNSHSHPLRLLVALTERVGHSHYEEGHINILGSPLSWNWTHGEQNKWPATLAPNRKWDAITLLSWAGDDNVYAPKFAGEACKGNPKCQVYIYVIWPDLNMSFEKPDPIRSEAHGEEVAAAVGKAFPNAPKPRVIPSSMLIRELGRLADMGELPGVANRFALFSDGGHLSHFGQYAVTSMVCAMLYGESPMDYPSDIFRQDQNGNPIGGTYNRVTVSDEAAVVIKRSVWDILQTYEPAGMKAGLVIRNRRLDVAIAGQPYKTELKAVHAQGQCAWQLVNGKLPTGISLAPSGIISGQSDAVGNYPLTVKLTSGSEAFERPLTLSVSPDTPPSIPDQPLPRASSDTYVFQPFKIAGGAGTVTWSLVDGNLPYGLLLSPVGVLVGTPGQEGEFAFKIRAEDSHLAGPRAAEREFKWKIGPTRPDSLPVKFVITRGYDLKQIQLPRDEDRKPIPPDSVLKVEGRLEEPFWNLDQSIERKVQGTPTKKAAFSAVWTANCSGNTIPGRPIPQGSFLLGQSGGRVWTLAGMELVLAIRVLDGAKGRTPKDGVHVFLDGRHDGQLIYGADDIHFFVPREFKSGSGWAPMARGVKPPWFSKVAVSEIDGGYVVEVSLGAPNFTGDGQWLSLGARSVYGLDIAVDEGDEGAVSQQVWRGDAHDAEDTSHFGTILLTGQPAVAPSKADTK